jgi:hypothetical protein
MYGSNTRTATNRGSWLGQLHSQLLQGVRITTTKHDDDHVDDDPVV